jgi:hypothetical protein
MAKTSDFWWDDDDVHFVCLFDFYSASW